MVGRGRTRCWRDRRVSPFSRAILRVLMLRHRPTASWTVVIYVAIVMTSVEFRAPSNSSQAVASRADVVVFGATPAGVTAAVSAARAGRKVVLLEPGRGGGGVVGGGSGATGD